MGKSIIQNLVSSITLRLPEPKRLCDLLAQRLRFLHELDFSDCPIKDRVGEYIARAEKNYRDDNYDKEHFPDSFG